MPAAPHFMLSTFDSGSPAGMGTASAILADAQLYLLGRVFEIDGENESRSTPSAVAAKMLDLYLRDGVRSFAESAGDFVVATCTSALPRTVTAYRSLTSQHQVYYRETSLSTSLLEMAREGSPVAIDTDFLDRFLLGLSGLQYSMPATPIAGIRRLLPGELVELRGATVRLTKLVHRRYRLTEKPQQTAEDIHPQLQGLLRKMVSDRLPQDSDQQVYSELSGGIDSSFVSGLVAQSGRRVQFILYNYGEKTESLSEQCARALAARYSAPLLVLPADELAAADLRDLDFPGDEPTAAYWQAATIGRALADIVPPGHRIFSGFGADELFMRRARILPAALADRGWRAAVSLSREIGSAHNRSALNLIWQSMISRLPRSMRVRFNTEDVDDLASIDAPVHWLGPRKGGRSTRWQAAVLAEGNVATQACFAGGGPEISGNGTQFADMEFITGPFLETRGVSYETPFCDLRLIDFVAREIDWRLIFNWRQTHKHLLREAAREILPEFVRMRASDALGVDGILRLLLRHNRETMRSLVFESGLPLENADPIGLQQAFDAMCFGSTQSSAHRVHALIGFSWWWRSFKKRMQTRC